MSQTENVATSSSKAKRPYRKGNPLSNTEKQRASIARKRATHKEVKVFIEPQLKELLINMCEQDGLTQAEIIERLIEREARNRNIY
ncbi:replication regulatory protein RepA [Hafnia alvei]|uniref:replication regulatory protein RepA n=1 Tax=Hafnia alvei TaxID=569 RepID=UPI0024323EDC|nr:replication regulatory protein RepA [Hafnia alvei]MEB7891796.1 replication regulatory protein RepA [Hafnia alvei]